MVILSLLGVALAIEGAGPPVEPTRETLRRYLTGQIGYSDRDWRDVLAGRAVAKNLETPEAVDVSIFGAVRVRGRARDLAEQIREIDVLERKLNVIGVGKFNDPPRLSDLDALELLESDVHDLRNCRPGDCELQLSENAMARFDALVDWDSSDAPAQATRIYREMVFDTLRTYLVGGVDTLGTYADRNPPSPISEEVHGLANPLDTPMPIPELTRFLREYPRSSLPGADEFFYWNMGEFGMKPTTRLNQVVIQPFPTGVASLPGLRYVIATGLRRACWACCARSSAPDLRQPLLQRDAGTANARRRRRRVLPALRHPVAGHGLVRFLQGPAARDRQAARTVRDGTVPDEHASRHRRSFPQRPLRPARGEIGCWRRPLGRRIQGDGGELRTGG